MEEGMPKGVYNRTEEAKLGLRRAKKLWHEKNSDPDSKQNYKFTQWSLAVRTRDKFTCQGSGPHKGYITAHHIKDWNNFPALRYEIANGVALCNSCHAREHGRIDKQIHIAFQEALYLIKYIEENCPYCGSSKHTDLCLIKKLASIIQDATHFPQRGETSNPVSIKVHYSNALKIERR